MIADVLVDPVEFDLELLGGEADSAEDAETARLADRHHHVTAVREREDRKLDVEVVADGGVHASSFGGRGRTGTCSSLVRPGTGDPHRPATTVTVA
jgi:hypothetical protein